MITLIDIPVVRSGAMPPVGSGCPWAPTVSGAGYRRVPAPIPFSAAAAARTAKAPRAEAAMKPLTVMGELPLVDNRKQNVHKTRVNAGGDGAMGPHPRRE